MKQETKEAAEKSIVAVGGAVATWKLEEANAWIAFFVGLATLTYVLVQMFFLMRKWYLLEKHSWNHIDTSPAPLDEHKRD